MIFSLVTLENARFFSPNERKITRYMNLLEEPKESRVNIDFAKMFERLLLVLWWHLSYWGYLCIVLVIRNVYHSLIRGSWSTKGFLYWRSNHYIYWMVSNYNETGLRYFTTQIWSSNIKTETFMANTRVILYRMVNTGNTKMYAQTRSPALSSLPCLVAEINLELHLIRLHRISVFVQNRHVIYGNKSSTFNCANIWSYNTRLSASNVCKTLEFEITNIFLPEL